MSLEITYKVITILVTIGYLQSGIENLIVSISIPSFNNYSLSQSRLTSKYIRWLKFGFDAPGIWIITMLKIIISAFVLIYAINGTMHPFLLLLLLVTDLLGFPRWRYLIVTDSPMQRAILVTITLHAFFMDTRISFVGLIFISVQLMLSYFTAGWKKIKDPFWRNGESMTHFLSSFLNWRTRDKLMQKNQLIKLLGWLIILFECCFWISLIGGWVTLLFLTLGFIFHGLLSIWKGLNFFFWTFISAYPAVLYISREIYRFLFE